MLIHEPMLEVSLANVVAMVHTNHRGWDRQKQDHQKKIQNLPYSDSGSNRGLSHITIRMISNEI